MGDLEEEKNKGNASTGRVIWVDPNMSNNTMVNPEDLCIKVDFSATKKNRSIIYSGKESINTIGNTGSVRFIEGSKVNEESTQPSLTTRYTEVIALDIMNMGDTKNFDDYESLGIESIDIEFNTAYAPMIKIKFIDVRGNAILSQGNMSKYSLFFELPYPIFSLKVKGFYGKTVNYCLHMQKWNAAFNSETGNFEIQAEFIGYTYALLTDMLMGLIRASVRTKRGQDRLKAKQDAYGENSNLIISIDDMLKRLNELNFTYQKTNEDDDSVQQVKTYDGISDDIANVKGLVTNLSTTIYDGQNPPNNYFRSTTGSVVGIPNNADNIKKADDAIKIYNESIKTTLIKINPNIGDEKLKLSEDTLTSIVIIKDVKYSEISNEDVNDCIPVIIQKSKGNQLASYSDNEEDRKKITILLKEIRAAITTPLSDNTTMNIYSFLRPYYHIDEKSAILKKDRDDKVQRITEEASNQAEETIGFEPTIRNIFRVLSVNCEIFLEVLREVSVEAQTDKDGKRAVEFNKISGKINVKEKEIKNNNIFPWPEYRQKKGTEGYVETWLGSAPGIIPMNIQEVVFTEELHKELLNVAKFDKELDAEQAEQGADIDSGPEQIKDPWFPVSVVDTPPSGMEQNPYIAACETGKSDEVLRLLLMRGFLLLGTSSYNSKIEPDLVKIYGELEAANLYEAAKKTENGLNIIKELQNLGGNTDPVKQTSHVFNNNGLEGKDTIKNPGVDEGKKKPIMVKNTRKINGVDTIYYKYTYIRDKDDNRSYIPVNKNYDGSVFYSGKKLKSEESIKKLSPDTIYVSKPKNLWEFSGGRNGANKLKSKSDGSYLFKIIDKNTYTAKVMAPSFGTDIVEKYKTKFAEKTIEPSTFKNAYILKPDNSNVVLGVLNPLGGNYAALEINNLDYTKFGASEYEKWVGEGSSIDKQNISSSISAFYSQNIQKTKYPFGSYLCNKNTKKEYYTDRMPSEEDKTFKIQKYDTVLSVYGEKNNSRTFENFGKQKYLIDKFLAGESKPYVPFIEFGFAESLTFSLFGSKFYNAQWSTRVKALLFLHTFPWQGVITPGDDSSEFAMFDTRKEAGFSESDPYGLTQILSIKSMFKINGAFVNVPKGWILFIGGILWRNQYGYSEGDDPLVFGNSGSNTNTFSNLIPRYGGRKPTIREYLYYSENNFEPWGMYFNSNSYEEYTQNNCYTPIDRTLLGLPSDIKDYLIEYFENWVKDEVSGFKYFQKELEIWYGKDSDKSNEDKSIIKYENKWKLIKQAIDASGDINTSKITKYLNDNPNILKNYNMVTTAEFNEKDVAESNGNFQFNLELRPDTEVMDNIVGLLTETVYIQNCVPSTLVSKAVGNADVSVYHDSIEATGYLLRDFMETFFTRLNSTEPSSEKTEDDQAEQEIFGTSDDKTINLLIYRTLSSINDKWINGTDDNSIFSQCSGSNKNPKDVALGAKYRSGATTAELIDTFRFVDRAFWDIGDKFYLNINAISDMIKHHYNDSFFDIVNKILTDNNFNFIPLPTFVNFNNIEELKTVFTPYSYNDEVGFSGTGPSFVCVFVGQSSTSLDLGPDSVYPDDGLSISMDESGAGLDLIDEKEDFGKEVGVGEFNVPVFAVNYGQQNQNYFKSVRLDQREFTETMESLQIIEDISQNGDKSKPTYAGNNLFNVYQTRSYSAEIEMMGSAMIQPMMYFQLNNIPMFRGAYLIYKVNHSIKPHSMTTTIKGNRVKKSKTPLIDKATMYMNLVGGNTNGGGTATIRSGSAAGDPNSKPESKFIDTNLQFYWLTNDGKIPTGKDTLGLTNTNKQFAGLKNVAQGNSYAVREVIEVLQLMGLTFYNANKGKANAPDTIFYNDLSRLWGGPLKPHKSHQKGLTMDIYQSKDSKAGYSQVRQIPKAGGYNREYTLQWLTYLFDTPYRKYTIPNDYKETIKYINLKGETKTAKAGDTVKDQRSIKNILFNDTGLQDIINKKYGKNLMVSYDNHDSHLHIEFLSPVRVVVESELGQNTRPATQANPADTNGSRSTSEIEARKQMKVEKLQPGFDVKFKRIITNGNYAGINITNYEDDWVSVSSNYIARSETFSCCPKDDQGNLRAGFGTDKILVNGSLKTVNGSTVFTEKIAKDTLVYQIKNSFAPPLEKNLGTSNWKKLNKYQRAALLSLTYNTGPAIFSQPYGKKIKDGIASGDFKEAAQGILDGPVSGKKDGYMDGLRKRRIQEARLFLLPNNEKVQYV